ncbi:unnamed protein product [Moneuplotes crassus]|uniref:DNA damage-inducible protein 1 n=1 Tax=Euplotes crassus TaxID=5936 RepID=A0AAD1XCH4_EUPCR|nr:unnamed protein product [Moneuplotes crassus]
MKLTIDDSIHDKFHSLELEDDAAVEDLKVLIEVQCGVQVDEQTLVFQGSYLQEDSSKLKHLGMRNNDIVQLQKAVARPPPSYGGMGMPVGGGGMGAPAPAPAPAPNFLDQMMGSLGGAPGGMGGGPPMATMDPLSAEYQKALEERIQQNNIDENYKHASEFNPELFVHTTMLYIECKINGNELQAFVDSGAQSTIMSHQCAERCNLLRLMDKRFSGIAKGVGTSRILGKIHAAQIQIGDVFFTTSITVLEDDKIDMLFGLDNLKRHKCSIDLANNQLTLDEGKVAVPFLKDEEINCDYVEEAKEAMMNVDKNNNMPEDEKIEELLKMGFEEADCIRALKQAGGNLQLAASILGNM